MLSNRYRHGLIAGGAVLILMLAFLGGSVVVPAITAGEDTRSTPPSVQFSVDTDKKQGVGVLTHAGGDPVDPSEVYIRGDGLAAQQYRLDELGASGTITSGESVRISLDKIQDPTQPVRIVWDPADTESSRTLQKIDGKDQVPPQTGFSVEYNSRESTVTISHSGGEPVRPAEIVVRGDHLNVERSRLDELGLNGTMTSGESVTVPVEDGAFELRIVWNPQDSEAAATLFRYQGPDA